MTRNNLIRVGTRGSQLARVQTDWVVSQLKQCHPGLECQVITIKTTGDVILDRSLSRVGGKGLFTEELEQAIRQDQIDLAVHSLKDLPTELSAGLAIGAIPAREDARDALVGLGYDDLNNSTKPVKIGTSSLRRHAQLRRLFPRAEIVNLRGNVDTRLRKVREGTVDATVLAMAGLNRLGRAGEVSHVFDLDELLPAPGQGALGIEVRADDGLLRDLLVPLHSRETEQRVTAERMVLQLLEGGCQVPVGAHARIENGELILRANVISLDGQRLIETVVRGTPADAVRIGEEAANALLKKGAGDIIAAIKNTGECDYA